MANNSRVIPRYRWVSEPEGWESARHSPGKGSDSQAKLADSIRQLGGIREERRRNLQEKKDAVLAKLASVQAPATWDVTWGQANPGYKQDR